MKKIVSIGIVVIALALLATEIIAGSASVRLTSPNRNVRAGRTTTVNVVIDASADIATAAQFTVSMSNSNFQVVGVEGLNGFQAAGSGGTYVLSRLSSTPLSSGSSIARITVRANSSANAGATSTLTVSNASVVLVDPPYESISAGSRSTTLTVAPEPAPVDPKSSNNYLKTLTSPVVDLEFVKTLLEYSVTVANDVTSLDLTAETEDAKATLSINNDADFKTGVNVVTVVVTAEDGSKRTYTIDVLREKSNNNLLKTLNIVGYEIDFDPETFEYRLDITDPDVTDLEIEYEVADENATVQILGNEDLQLGRNIVRIIVTAENGEQASYTLTVNVHESDLVVDEDGANLVIVILTIIFMLIIAGQVYFIYRWRKGLREE